MTQQLSRSEAERNAAAIVYFKQAELLANVDPILGKYLEDCGRACLAYDAKALFQSMQMYKNRIEELIGDREKA